MKATSCETLCVKVFHQILSPVIALKRSEQYFWAGSLVLGNHHFLKTTEKFILQYIEFHDVEFIYSYW